MCRATVGARPVKRCTVAASVIFSSIVRGVPGVPNTLKRVPELPNAHDGSSILRLSSNELVMLLPLVGRRWIPWDGRNVRSRSSQRFSLSLGRPDRADDQCDGK